METTTSLIATVGAWIIGCSIAGCVAWINRGDRPFIDILAIGFISGCFAGGSVGYLVFGNDFDDGAQYRYMAIAVPVGAFAWKFFLFVDKRTDQVFNFILARFGIDSHDSSEDQGDWNTDDSDSDIRNRTDDPESGRIDSSGEPQRTDDQGAGN